MKASKHLTEQFTELLPSEISDAEDVQASAPPEEIYRPLIAVIGRPNVGKSTLFNRLVGAGLAVVQDEPGVTRDRNYADAEVGDRAVIFVDTGGFDPESEDPLRADISRQVNLALEEADLVLCVFDATAEPTRADYAAAELLRNASKPVIYCANKADSSRRVHQSLQYYQLGLPNLVSVSALHGHGVGELDDALAAALPQGDLRASRSVEGLPRIAVVGRPNAGKSSLINHLLGEYRQITDDRPGTTVDSIDSVVSFRNRRWVFTDTAGIRRKRSVEEGTEGLAVLRSLRSLERSDVVLLMIDAQVGAAEQDAKIASLAVDRGRSVLIGLNKADTFVDRKARADALQKLQDTLYFMPWAPRIELSAKLGQGVGKVMHALDRTLKERSKRITTGEVNRFFETVLDRHPPPSVGGRLVRLLYITQVQISPPTFVAVANDPKRVHPSYRRYVINQIRAQFGFYATPIRVLYRSRQKGEKAQVFTSG